jgi:cell division protein FtsX
VTYVQYQFRPQASEEIQDQVRRQILEIPGVKSVARISPNATKDVLSRAWYASVTDDGTASHVVTQLRQHDYIQSADLPPKRGLL